MEETLQEKNFEENFVGKMLNGLLKFEQVQNSLWLMKCSVCPTESIVLHNLQYNFVNEINNYRIVVVHTLLWTIVDVRFTLFSIYVRTLPSV